MVLLLSQWPHQSYGHVVRKHFQVFNPNVSELFYLIMSHDEWVSFPAGLLWLLRPWHTVLLGGTFPCPAQQTPLQRQRWHQALAQRPPASPVWVPLSFQGYYLDNKIHIQMQFTLLNNWKSIYFSLWNIVSICGKSMCLSWSSIRKRLQRLLCFL